MRRLDAKGARIDPFREILSDTGLSRELLEKWSIVAAQAKTLPESL
jgi:hypothetical protein